MKGIVQEEPRRNSRLLDEGKSPDQEKGKTSKCKIPQLLCCPFPVGKLDC